MTESHASRELRAATARTRTTIAALTLQADSLKIKFAEELWKEESRAKRIVLGKVRQGMRRLTMPQRRASYALHIDSHYS
jgi:hypothetical protein